MKRIFLCISTIMIMWLSGIQAEEVQSSHERLDMRTSHSRTWQVGENTYTTRIYTQPIDDPGTEGEWSVLTSYERDVLASASGLVVKWQDDSFTSSVTAPVVGRYESTNFWGDARGYINLDLSSAISFNWNCHPYTYNNVSWSSFLVHYTITTNELEIT